MLNRLLSHPLSIMSVSYQLAKRSPCPGLDGCEVTMWSLESKATKAVCEALGCPGVLPIQDYSRA
jgi:hypothetical protein